MTDDDRMSNLSHVFRSAFSGLRKKKYRVIDRRRVQAFVSAGASVAEAKDAAEVARVMGWNEEAVLRDAMDPKDHEHMWVERLPAHAPLLRTV